MKLCFKDFWYTFIDFFSSASLAISGTKNEVLVGAELNGDGQQWLLVLFPFLFPLLGGDKRPRAKARPTIVSHPQPNTEIVSRIITRPKGQEGPWGLLYIVMGRVNPATYWHSSPAVLHSWYSLWIEWSQVTRSRSQKEKMAPSDIMWTPTSTRCDGQLLKSANPFDFFWTSLRHGFITCNWKKLIPTIRDALFMCKCNLPAVKRTHTATLMPGKNTAREKLPGGQPLWNNI